MSRSDRDVSALLRAIFFMSTSRRSEQRQKHISRCRVQTIAKQILWKMTVYTLLMCTFEF